VSRTGSRWERTHLRGGKVQTGGQAGARLGGRSEIWLDEALMSGSRLATPRLSEESQIHAEEKTCKWPACQRHSVQNHGRT
jgi:hypothetical protein